ncbi:tetratricopeptide repeat protein [Alkalimarinus alittae]|uniref:Tetratricopeptide repeat protein n=1 Tax=Alkalimarinus alittae TaxID=2961619 RepID=A0ABY6N6T6_9ALTE|nr:tetratricopeptide repeat protein [Alkalimarinus alittae]UZE97806.1 tetratricopeptide repeat protein [Alkalimarinus alittae]
MASIAIFSSRLLSNMNSQQSIKVKPLSASRFCLQLSKLFCVAVFMFVLSACSGVAKKTASGPSEQAGADIAAIQVIDTITLQSYQQAIDLIEHGKLADADKLLIKVADKYPDLAAPLYNLGVIAENQKDIDSAVEYYNRAIAADKKYYLAYNNLGIISRSKGDFDQALSYYKLGLKAAPYNAELNYNMAVLNEIYLHDYKAAIKYYEQYLASFDDNSVSEPDKNVVSWIKDLKRRSK